MKTWVIWRTAFVLSLAAALLGVNADAQTGDEAKPVEGDYVRKNFAFKDGETLPELKLHYMTFGKPLKDANGRVTNAVLIMHGTGGSGRQFLAKYFAGELFGPGQLLDQNKYFIILRDGIGHGRSSKPSDGLHMKFPKYDYDDMVAADHLLLSEALGVNHLRLVMGTSMGCMHSFVWAETYPDFIDAAMPMACLPVQIAGRNRLWRQMAMHAITSDPEWKGGEYTQQPKMALERWLDFLLVAGSAPIQMQKQLPTRDSVDKFLEEAYLTRTKGLDANDILYQVAASRNYDPSSGLGKIKVPVMWINSADDFINPPELGIAEEKVKEIKKGKFVLIPASDKTYGHGTHTHAEVWKGYLEELLRNSGE